MVDKLHKLINDYKHLSAPMWVDYSEDKSSKQHKKDVKMASNRFNEKEMDRIFELRSAGTDKDAAIALVLSERETKIDRDALRAFVQTELQNAKTPATDKLFKALSAIDSALKSAETEQAELAIAITSAVSSKFGQDAANILKFAKCAYATAENGGKNVYDKLSVSVPERKEIVHPADYQGNALGREPLTPAELAEAKKLVSDKTAEAMQTWYDGVCKAITAETDKLAHNSTFRKVEFEITGEKPADTTNYGKGSICFKVTKPVYKTETAETK